MPPASPLRLRRAHGATLLELLTVTLIVAVICALGLPALGTPLSRLRADTVRMQMATAFNLARNTAITRSRTVAVCPSADGRTCGDNWSHGWLIHYDRGGTVTHPAEEDILRFQAGSAASNILATASAGRPRLRFQRDGRSGGSTLTVSICADEALHSQVIVNNVGRTRTRRTQERLPCPH